MRYVDRNGRTVEIKDRTKDPIYNVRYSLGLVAKKVKGVLEKLRPKDETYTGRYKFIKGKWVKVDFSARIPDLWIKKHSIDAEKDRRDAYKSLESQGKLREVNDRDVWSRYADR